MGHAQEVAVVQPAKVVAGYRQKTRRDIQSIQVSEYQCMIFFHKPTGPERATGHHSTPD